MFPAALAPSHMRGPGDRSGEFVRPIRPDGVNSNNVAAWVSRSLSRPASSAVVRFPSATCTRGSARCRIRSPVVNQQVVHRLDAARRVAGVTEEAELPVVLDRRQQRVVVVGNVTDET